jgi:hypothetical protein
MVSQPQTLGAYLHLKKEKIPKSPKDVSHPKKIKTYKATNSKQTQLPSLFITTHL